MCCLPGPLRQWEAILGRCRDEEACPKRLIACPQACGEMLVFDSMHDHVSTLCPLRIVASCPKRPVQCNFGCTAALTFDNLTCHLSESCPYRMVSCRRCGDEGFASSLEKHESSSCPKRLVACLLCAGEVVFDLVPLHLRTQCPKRTVSCELCHGEVESGLLQSERRVASCAGRCSKQNVWRTMRRLSALSGP